jgi:hypothetical protein
MANDSVGLESLQVNGTVYDVVGSCTYQIGGAKSGRRKEPKVLQGGKVVHTVTWREPYIEVELSDSGQLDTEALAALENALVIARLVNGKSVVCKGANVTGDLATNAAEGTLTAHFTGQSCEEVKSS